VPEGSSPHRSELLRLRIELDEIATRLFTLAIAIDAAMTEWASSNGHRDEGTANATKPDH
jgi:hypothetical protein